MPPCHVAEEIWGLRLTGNVYHHPKTLPRGGIGRGVHERREGVQYGEGSATGKAHRLTLPGERHAGRVCAPGNWPNRQ